MTLDLEIWEWFKKCFPDLKWLDKKQRTARFLEEAIELGQALDFPKEDVLKLVDYVYSRPKGEVGQEIAGVGITFSILCNSQAYDANVEIESELIRINNPVIVDQIRAKQKMKDEVFGV